MYQVEINKTGKWEVVGTYDKEGKAKLIGKTLAIKYDCDYWVERM